MGGATYICSDKTGTLTQNKMTVMALMAGDQVVFGDKPTAAKEITEAISIGDLNVWQLIQRSILWNKRIDSGIEQHPETKKWFTKGNETEKGMLDFLMRATTPKEVRDVIDELKAENVLCSVEFSSQRKKSSIAVYDPDSD